LKGSGDKLTKAELKWAMGKAGSGSVNYSSFLDQMFSGLPAVGEVIASAPVDAGFGSDDDDGFGGGGFGEGDADDDDGGDGDEFGF